MRGPSKDDWFVRLVLAIVVFVPGTTLAVSRTTEAGFITVLLQLFLATCWVMDWRLFGLLLTTDPGARLVAVRW